MKILISFNCVIVYLIVPFVADVCEATCDEYIIIFEEKTCPIYRFKPLTHQGIIDFVGANDCNLTDLYNKNKECLLEFDCMKKDVSCKEHIKPTNKQSHIVIPEDTKSPPIFKRNLSYVNINKTKENETSIVDVHLTFENVNDALNESTKETKDIKIHDKIICKYAEIVCNDEGNKTVKKVFENTDSYFYKNSTIFIDISIDRDETSTIQPLFTGYFREQSKEPLSSYENDFKNLKTASLKCPLLNDDTSKCSKSKSIHAYINTTYIQSGTKTNYPNCTMDSEMINNTFNLICDNVTFAKYNKHLELTSKQKPSPLSDEKEKLDNRSWSCQIMECKDILTAKQPDNNVSEIYFKNCFRGLSSYNTTNNKGKTEITSSKPDILKKDNTSDTNPKDTIKIIVTENANCTQNLTLNIQHGKFVNFEGKTDKNKLLKNDVVELNIVNCPVVNNSTVNGTDKLSEAKVEMTIFLKNKSLSTSDLKLLNKIAKKEKNKEKDGREELYLRCYSSNVSSNKTTKNTTILECEIIDPKDLIIIPENNSDLNQNPTQELRSWNCQITEIKEPLITKRNNNDINEIYFKDCFKGSSLHSNNTGNSKEENGVTSTKPDILIKDNTTDISPKKILKIIVTENANCTQNLTFNIQQGKFVNFEEKTDKKNILINDVVELNIADCIKINNSTVNGTDKLSQVKLEMTVFLKNETLTASDFKLLNKAAKQEQNKEIDGTEKLYLRCDSSVSSNKTTKNTTALECETIDPKDLIIIPENNSDLNQNTTQDLRSWNCQITEIKEPLITKRKHNGLNEIYFKDCFKGLSLTSNNTGNSKERNGVTSTKPDIFKNDNITDISPKKIIKLIVTENANCTQNVTLNIQQGKFVDFEVNNDTNNILKNDAVELNIANCVTVNSSAANGTDKLLQKEVEMTIFLKNESLTASDLKLFNKAAKQEQNKEIDGREKLYLRCDSSHVSSNKTKLECETIDPKDLKLLVNSTGSKDNEENLPNEKDKREIQTKITFNRKKDVNKLGNKENLVGSTEVETIILITLAVIAGTSLLLLLVFRLFRKPEHRYNPAATREPAADEETAF